MRPEEMIYWILAFGVLVGAADKILGNRFGLGEKFDDGFKALGPLALGMVGIYCLSPVISKILGPFIIPVFVKLSIDPAMFGAILANDMGGYPLSMELAMNEQAGLLSGAIVSSMLGCTLVFSIPVGLGLIDKNDEPFFFKGIIIGLISIPAGSVIGGIAAGFQASLVIVNTIPVLVQSAILSAGLIFIPDKTVKGAIIFGKFITIILYIGLACAAFEFIAKITIIEGMIPIMESMQIVAGIGIFLLGIFPILSLILKLFDKPLNYAGKWLGIDSASVGGIIITFANSVPVYLMIKDMNNRGKIINVAWLVPATAVFGDHLGFTAAVRPDMVIPVILGKLSAGLLAFMIALHMTKPDRIKNDAVFDSKD